MKIKFLVAILITIILSSCSTLNFNQRKYFDFKRSTNDLSIQKKTTSYESSKSISLSTAIDTVRKNDCEYTVANSVTLKKGKAISVTPHVIDQNPNTSSGGLMSVKKHEKKLVSSILNKNHIKLRNSPDNEPTPKGQLWWLAIIIAIIFLIIALFAYAGFFTFMAILFFLTGIWDLVLLIKYKHKLAEWKKGNNSTQPQEKQVEEQKEKPTEQKKKRG